MDTMVEKMCEQHKIEVPWGGAVVQMLCHDEYIFWGRRWGNGTSGSSLQSRAVMCCEFFFVVKMRFLKVSDERGEGWEVHSNATYGRKDGGVFAGGECPIGQDCGGVCPGAKAFKQKFRTWKQFKKEGDCRMK